MFLRRMITAVALTTIATGAIATINQAAASADTATVPNLSGHVSLTVGDVHYTAAGDCLNTPVTLDVEMPDDYAYMNFEFSGTYTGPTTVPDTVYGYGYYSGVDNSNTFVVCPVYDLPGTYRASVDVTFYDYDYNVIDAVNVGDTFTVASYVAPSAHPTPAPVHHNSNALTRRNTDHHHGWNLSTSYFYDGRGRGNVRVDLQRQDFGQWHTVQRHFTNGSGETAFHLHPRRGPAKRYRTVVQAFGGTAAHVSRSVRIARH